MTWALQDAKNRFSAVAETAAKGQPQVVTRHGRPIVVIISYETYCEKISPASQKNIAEAFMDCRYLRTPVLAPEVEIGKNAFKGCK